MLRGSESEPVEVQKNNPQPVQNRNPQKKPFKQTERNTTGSSGKFIEVLLIAEYWNEVFSKQINLSDVSMVDHIEKCLNHFGVVEIKKAIFNRSRTTYYREKKPFLINKPSAFFPWPETVANDLKREPEGIYTYDQKNDRISQLANIVLLVTLLDHVQFKLFAVGLSFTHNRYLVINCGDNQWLNWVSTKM